jgi:hypothetical protein
MTSTGIDMQDLRAGRSIPPGALYLPAGRSPFLPFAFSNLTGAAPAMYPPVPAYAAPSDHQRASTTAAVAIDPPPLTIPNYTPLENGTASAPAEDAASLHPPAVSCSRGDDSDLPLYQNVSERLPAYTSRPPPSSFGGHEPRTLPMILFKIGFCTFSFFFLLLLPHLTHCTGFPPMWILGASFLVARCSSKWYPWLEERQRTEAERAAFMARVRVVEVMWARRCLIALGMVLCFGLATGVTAFAIMQADSKIS